MNQRTLCMCGISFLSIFLLLGAVNADQIIDQSDDVWHQEKNQDSNQWEWKQNNLSNYAYIDVTNVEYDLTTNLSVSIAFSASINTSRIIGCEVFYGTYTPYQYYRFRYTTDTNMLEMTSFGFSFSFNKTIPFSFVENNTKLEFTTSLPQQPTAFSLWGFTYEYSTDYLRYWADFFPESYEPTNVNFEDADQNDQDQQDNENDDNSSDDITNGNTDQTDTDETNVKTDDTPGFGFMLLFIAVFCILFLIKRRS